MKISYYVIIAETDKYLSVEDTLNKMIKNIWYFPYLTEW